MAGSGTAVAKHYPYYLYFVFLQKVNKRRGQVVNTSASFSKGHVFKSRPGDWIS
jgi:hypothetical protein